MTDSNHPITPPAELVEQWRTAPEYASDTEKLTMVSMTTRRLQEIADQAAQYGSDQELEACCDAVYIYEPIRGGTADWLRSARRPKPPSPKEKALKVLETLIEWQRIYDSEYQALRHALEQLPND